jgi:acetyltransferase-like isoleucine patch superfamily enzyme
MPEWESYWLSQGVHVHFLSDVDLLAEIGAGTYVWRWTNIQEGVRIGRNCKIGQGCFIGRGAVIGNDCSIQSSVIMADGVTLEDNVFVGPNVTFTNDLWPRVNNPDWKVVPIWVCEGASIGAGSVIVPGVTIGRGAMVGAGAVVRRDVPAGRIVVGNPARLLPEDAKGQPIGDG